MTRPIVHAPARHNNPLRRSSNRGALGALGDTGLEAVLELPGHGAEVPHAAGTGDLSALRLLGPVVCSRCVSVYSSGWWSMVPDVGNVHLRILAAG